MDDAAFWRHVRQQLVQLIEIDDTLAEATTLAEDLQTPAQMSLSEALDLLDLLATMRFQARALATDTEVQEGDLETDSPTNTQAQ